MNSTQTFTSTRPTGSQAVVRWLLVLPSVVIIALTLIAIVGVVAYQVKYAGNIYPGVNVLGWDVSGMTPYQAETFLRDKIRYYEDAQLLFRYGNQIWIATPRDLGAQLDARAAADEAYAIGRTSDLRENLWRQVEVYQHGYTVLPRTVFDPVQARAYVDGLANEINLPAQEAAVVVNGATVEVVQSRMGRHLDIPPAVFAIQQRILNHSDAPIDLKVEEIQPAIHETQALAAKQRIDRLLSAPIVLYTDNRTWVISREQLQAWLVIHKTTGGGAGEIQAYIDSTKIREWVEPLAAEVYQRPGDARLSFDPETEQVIVVENSHEGRTLDIDTTVGRIVTASQSEARTIPIAVLAEKPAIDEAAITAAKERIDQLLSAPIVIHYGDQAWRISREMLWEWLVIDQSTTDGALEVKSYIDPKKVRRWVEPLAAEVYQLPEDARLDFDPDTGQVSVIQASREGYTLDVRTTVDRIVAATESTDRTVPLAVTVEKPAVDERDTPKMGIVELVGQASTSFGGSPAGRIKNIQIATSKFHGVVVPPGETFSFNHYLGDVSAEEGYEEAYIIKGDRTTVGLGGGVCQVSTTAFRAAFFSGLPIVERWAHGYRVSWYETDSIPGLDATIYSPWVDLKFRNDTTAYLLIETEVDPWAGTLTFFFYGTSPKREVELEGPEIENVTPAKDPVYEVDADLPPGTVKQIDWANEGSDVTVYRIIKQAGQVISRERFDSHYNAWSDIFLVSSEELIPEEFRKATDKSEEDVSDQPATDTDESEEAILDQARPGTPAKPEVDPF